MKKFFTLWIAASWLLITVASINAQDAQNPWHLVAFENGKEVAFYNTEVITEIEATAQSIKIVLDNGMEFSHPTATTTFGFDPRREGTATTNENFTTPQWNVYYSNGKLHFIEMVNSVVVFTINGALLAQFSGSYSEVSVNLSSGIYVIQADNKSAKLLVNNGSGSTVARQEIVTKTAIEAHPVPIGLRSDNNIKEYWNIIANSTTMSIKISDVEKFSFKSDTLVFTLKNGGSVELSNYQGVEFTIEPSEPTGDTHWDLERTFAIGGGSYGFDGYLLYPASVNVEFTSVVSQTDIIIYDFTNAKETKYSRSGISSDLLNRNDAQVSFCNLNDDFSFPAISYTINFPSFANLNFYSILPNDPRMVTVMPIIYDFNGGTNKIPTAFSIDKDSNLVATYVNADGISRQHTFKK